MASAIEQGWGHHSGPPGGHGATTAAASPTATGETILDEWHHAKLAHKAASNDDKDIAYHRMTNAEHKAAEHFGLGKHIKAYEARFTKTP